MTIGIFGGTFDPPHIGHLIVAERALSELRLDKVIFVPAAIPPHKVNDGIAASRHRVEMLRLALQNSSRFEISETEIIRGGVSFTVDTLAQLRSEHPGDQFFLLIGMDNLLDFSAWKSPERILELAMVVVMTRPGFDLGDVPDILKGKVMVCPVPDIEVSSREIRKRVNEGKSIRYLVPDAVRTYIEHYQLYSGRTN
jgi:nicotinate-nucleotide adenylyltransferase